MGTVARPGFDAHYDKITPYLSSAHVEMKDLEINAVTPEFAYTTCLQHFSGTAADGIPFEFTFRATSVLRKVGGEWKYVHEHFSFPVNMSTMLGDRTSGQDVSKNIEFKKE
jgi:ketosteroid isomerase-like protein